MVISQGQRDHTRDLMQIHDRLGRQFFRRMLDHNNKRTVFGSRLNFSPIRGRNRVPGAVCGLGGHMDEATTNVHKATSWFGAAWRSKLMEPAGQALAQAPQPVQRQLSSVGSAQPPSCNLNRMAS